MKAEYDLYKLKSRKNHYASRLKSTNQMAASGLMKAAKFEHQFDEAVDMTALLDLSKARRVIQAQKRVIVDFPEVVVESLDCEANKFGVTKKQ